MSIEIHQVDAFTDRPFGGNPAAVCFPPADASEEWMQAVAAEMNLSETAFVVPIEADFELRWFTPTVEVELCGHATLASAHILWETGRLERSAPARFRTRKSGVLTCRWEDGQIQMDFPALPSEPCEPPAGLAEALGVSPRACARSPYDYVVEVATEAEARTAAPDFRALAAWPVRGVILTARGEGGFDFVSRFFAPAVGIDEDPATGSAHCCLGPYWAAKLGKTELKAFQASRRGATIGVRVAGDRVELSGRARTVFSGELRA